MADNKTQLAVIGAGPGGYAAAFMAADLGLEVTLIDPAENPGGVCLYRGCIPSKTLLHAARVIEEAAEARDWGIAFSTPKIDVKALRRRKEQVVETLTGGLGQLMKQRKIRHIRGTATFTDNRHLQIDREDGDSQDLEFEKAIVATGSRPVVIPALDVDSDRLIGSRGALALEAVPKKLLVIGGGYIGLELGSVYAALGSKVTVVEMTGQLLPGADRDLVRPLAKRLEDRFEEILLNTTVSDIKVQKNGLKVTLDGDDEQQTRIFERVLMAVGRKPNTDGLGLDAIGVELDDNGFIQVDDQRRTGEPNIFAIGDVAGEPMLAHKASHEGRVAAEVIAGRKVAYQPAAIPAVVFTDPEIAWTGLTETDAKKQGKSVQVSRFPWAASGRAQSIGRVEGLTKVLVDPDTERIVGVGLVGPGAGEMIAEGVLAVEMGANVMDVGLSIHPHPTLSETIMEAADIFHGTATHVYRPKKKKK